MRTVRFYNYLKEWGIIVNRDNFVRSDGGGIWRIKERKNSKKQGYVLCSRIGSVRAGDPLRRFLLSQDAESGVSDGSSLAFYYFKVNAAGGESIGVM